MGEDNAIEKEDNLKTQNDALFLVPPENTAWYKDWTATGLLFCSIN